MIYTFMNLSGNKVPKYQTAPGPLPDWYNNLWQYKALKGWTPELDASNAGTNIRNDYHGHAGDLNTAFKANEDYIASGNVGKDILTFANAGQYTDINDFINKYNLNINTLNGYFNTEISYGDAAKDHNQLFKSMYASRAAAENGGVSGNIGYLVGLENKAGSSTWLRRGDRYEKEFDLLTDKEKGRRTHTVTLNGQNYSVYKKANGEIAILPSSDKNITGGDDIGGGGDEDTNKHFDPLWFPQEMQKRSDTPWTDWLPISLQHMEDMMLADRYADLKKKLKFPLKEAPFLQHKITDNYHLRSLMGQQSADLRQLGQVRSLSSDITLNLDNIRKYDTEAANIENQAEQEKANKFALETQVAENVANINKLASTETANYNAALNAAAWNNIVEANAERAARRAASIKNYIGNMATSHGEWLKDMRLNDQAYARGMNQYLATLYSLKAYNEYNEMTDFKNSKAYKQFVNDITNQVIDPGGSFDSDKWNDERDTYAAELWDTDLGKSYRDKWGQELQDALQNYYLRNQQIGNLLQAANLMIPDIINNQGFRFMDNELIPVYWSFYPQYAQGGRVARFVDYVRHHERVQKHAKDLLHKRVQEENKNLRADLDRLSREEMMLLRAIFK